MTAEHPLPWLLPITVMLTVFGIYPLAYSIWLSFHKRNVVSRQLVFSGWDQWVRLFHDARAWHALSVTLTYAVVALIIQLVLGMGDRPSARHGPQGLRRPARADDVAAGGAAGRDRA